MTTAADVASPARAGSPAELFRLPVLDVARALLGWTLLVDGVGGVIVETEAYRQDDPASHSFRGPTPRTAAMFGPPGRLYVYRSYGLHWCANITCERDGHGAAVLLRALQPTRGLDLMRRRRGIEDARQLCSGPGKLTQALAVTAAAYGAAVDRAPFSLTPPDDLPDVEVTTRIGITRGVERPWRFVVRGSPWASRRRVSVRPRA